MIGTVSADQKKEKKGGFFSFLSGKKKQESAESEKKTTEKKSALKKNKKTKGSGKDEQDDEQEDEEVVGGASPGNRFSVFNKENEKKGDHKLITKTLVLGQGERETKVIGTSRENVHQQSQEGGNPMDRGEKKKKIK